MKYCFFFYWLVLFKDLCRVVDAKFKEEMGAVKPIKRTWVKRDFVLWREKFTFIPERGFIFARVKTGQVGTWSLVE